MFKALRLLPALRDQLDALLTEPAGVRGEIVKVPAVRIDRQREGQLDLRLLLPLPPALFRRLLELRLRLLAHLQHRNLRSQGRPLRFNGAQPLHVLLRHPQLRAPLERQPVIPKLLQREATLVNEAL